MQKKLNAKNRLGAGTRIIWIILGELFCSVKVFEKLSIAVLRFIFKMLLGAKELAKMAKLFLFQSLW